ncbi:glycosyltransferase family 2 protein, partial [Candidatus Gottesmanbacteria bacterium]|nr:glycosyltransferase family 2 protein [Candidatus Gottesmanbacteria bacterium]
MKLSVVLATFNEEKNLAACLDSVKGLADEIVVVDGGSDDKTVEIGKSFGAKVIITTNPPIFHINKQKAIDEALGDWILQLDADERVTPELSKEIKSEIRNPKSEINGYWIPRKNWFLGRFLMKGGQYPDYTLRLYRRGKGRLPCKTVHEQAMVDGKVGYLKNSLIHMADTGFSRYLVRWNRYTDLIAQEIKEQFREKEKRQNNAIVVFCQQFIMTKKITNLPSISIIMPTLNSERTL